MSILHENEIKGNYKWLYKAILLVLIIGIPLQMFPFLWMISNMFKSSVEIFRVPLTFLPDHIRFENIASTFAKYHLLNNLWNSLVLCFGTILLQVPISALTAFSISKLKPKGAKLLLLFFVGTLMIDNQSTMIPMYIMMHDFPLLHINLINSYWSVLLPFSAWGWSVFIFKGFFDGFPDALLESVRIDGGSNLVAFVRVVVPLSKPVFAVIILNTFRAVFNQFMFPLMMLPAENKWTLMVRIYAASVSSNSQWFSIMVVLTFAIIPVMIFYIFTQKYIIQGISMTGLKG